MTHDDSQNVLKRYPNKLLMQNINSVKENWVPSPRSDKLRGDHNKKAKQISLIQRVELRQNYTSIPTPGTHTHTVHTLKR